jgi:hypothetical protein
MKTIFLLLIIALFKTGAYAQAPCSKGEQAGPMMQFNNDLEKNTLKFILSAD